MIALLATAAFAGDGLLSGGLSATPTAASLIVPSWRIGYASGRVTGWGTATWASFGADVDEPLSGFALRPRAGLRFDLDDRGPEQVVPYVSAGASTVLFGIAVEDEQVLEDEEVTGRLPFGLQGGFGLDAGVTEVLSVSAEIGLDWENGRWESDRTVTVVNSVTTFAGIYLNLWF